jgi:hypothetical protein
LEAIAQAPGKAGLQLAHLGLDAVAGVQGVRAGQQKDGEARRGLAVQPRELVLALGSQFDPGDVLEVSDLPVRAGLEDDAGELLGVDQAAEGAHGVLKVLALGDRRLADLPGRHLHVLLAQDPDHVPGRQVPRLRMERWGQKIYLWVARNRFRLVPCHGGVCSLPPSPHRD